MDCERLVTQESHCFSCGSLKSLNYEKIC